MKFLIILYYDELFIFLKNHLTSIKYFLKYNLIKKLLKEDKLFVSGNRQ